MTRPLRFGCNGRGAQHAPGRPVSVDEQFRMVKESGVFDFFDRMPQPGEENEYVRASEKYGLPMTTGLWSYAKGRDEALLRHNLALSARVGAECHNIMLFARDADGAPLTDDDVARWYLMAYDLAEKANIAITFEVHIYMWSEDFRRVTRVAQKVSALDAPSTSFSTTAMSCSSWRARRSRTSAAFARTSRTVS